MLAPSPQHAGVRRTVPPRCAPQPSAARRAGGETVTTGAYVGGAVAPQQSAMPASVGLAPVVSAPMPVAPRVAGSTHSLAEELEKLKQVPYPPASCNLHMTVLTRRAGFSAL